MAIVTNTFQTYQAIGDREDLTDIIYNISPTDTPFMSSIGKEKASGVLHEWQTDDKLTTCTPSSTRCQDEQ